MRVLFIGCKKLDKRDLINKTLLSDQANKKCKETVNAYDYLKYHFAAAFSVN